MFIFSGYSVEKESKYRLIEVGDIILAKDNDLAMKCISSKFRDRATTGYCRKQFLGSFVEALCDCVKYSEIVKCLK